MFARGLAVLEIEFKQKGKQSNWHPTLYNFLWFQLLIGMTTDFFETGTKNRVTNNTQIYILEHLKFATRQTERHTTLPDVIKIK